jgi:hypothetical protein
MLMTTSYEDLNRLETEQLLSLWSRVMEELRQRGVIRSSNNPVADYTEGFTARRLGLTLVGNSTSGHDAIDADGRRYQIKARRLLRPNTSRQLSALRNLNGDPFDFLVVVLFAPAFDVLELWQSPIDLVREHAVFRPHVNAHILYARGAILADRRAVRIRLDEDMKRLRP